MALAVVLEAFPVQPLSRLPVQEGPDVAELLPALQPPSSFLRRS